MQQFVDTVKRFLASRFSRFALVGLSVTVLGAVLLSVLISIFGMSPEWANFVQAVVSVEANFFANNWWTWRDRRDGNVFVRWVKFHAAKFFITIPLNQALFVLMVQVDFLRENYVVPYLINIAIIMLINFGINELFVFRTRSAQAGPQQKGTDE